MEELKDVTWDAYKTKEYYKINEACTCSYCRNYYQTVKEFYPALGEFLTQFGLSIENPIEAVHFYREANGLLYYQAWFAVVRNNSEGI